jgi:dienelactone hydrolase
MRERFRAGFPGKLDTQVEPFKRMIEQLRKQGYERVGAVGFCWCVLCIGECIEHGIQV